MHRPGHARRADDDEIFRITKFDPWFLARIREIIEAEDREVPNTRTACPATEDGLRALKMMGFTDARLAKLTGRDEADERVRRAARTGRRPRLQADRHLRRRVRGADALHVLDLRSAHDGRGGMRGAMPSDRKKVVILGGGPNRIGQGIEFDYCCCPRLFRADRCGL